MRNTASFPARSRWSGCPRLPLSCMVSVGPAAWPLLLRSCFCFLLSSPRIGAARSGGCWHLQQIDADMLRSAALTLCRFPCCARACNPSGAVHASLLPCCYRCLVATGKLQSRDDVAGGFTCHIALVVFVRVVASLSGRASSSCKPWNWSQPGHLICCTFVAVLS